MAVQLAAQLGEDLGNRSGRTRGSRDQTHARGTSTTQVLVRLVENALGVGQVVDGGDRAVADAQVLVNYLDHRGQAIGGAGSGGDDTVLRRVEQVLVDAHHHVQRAFLLHRSADHHAFDALVQVGLEHGYRLHLAAGFDDQITARPVGVGDRLVRGDLDALALDHHRVAFCLGFTLPAAVDRIEVDQVGVGLGVADRVIDLDEFEFRPAPGRAQRQATDTAKPIDAYFDCHGLVLEL
ncbi:hypothetical protein D3C71_1530920 [compost metagenome]